MLKTLDYDKFFIIDTNIILDDVKNIEMLSENGKNLLIIPDTVIKELDKFKIGQETINYNAREFARFLSDAEIVSYNDSLQAVYIKKNEIKIILVSSKFEGDFSPDQKIIEAGIEVIKKLNLDKNNVIFLSNDIYFRTLVILKGYKTESFLKNKDIKNIEYYRTFEYQDCFLNKEYFNKIELEKLLNTELKPENIILEINEYTGKKFILLKENAGGYRKIDLKKNLNLYGIKPRNLEQRIMWEMLSNNKTDIFVFDAIAGTGKTLSALVNALNMFDKGIGNKITYIRKTIISGDKSDELGFLPGDLKDKLLGYIYPLKDNIELLVRLKNKKKKKWSKEELEKAIENFENQYNIEYDYLGHLRGRNLSGIILIDECQNFSIKDITTILSRITEGSKVIITGSTKQIDNPYLNKYNNALTFLMEKIGTIEPVQVQGMKLNKVERGNIVEWIEKITQ